MSMEPMLANLEREADLERKKISEETQDKIDNLRKEVEDKIQVMRQSSLAQAKEALDLEEARIIGQAKAEASKLLLEARRNEFDSIFKKSSERIEKLQNDPEYPQILLNLIQEASIGFTGKLVAEVSPRDVKTANEIFRKLKKEAEIKPNSEISGGVIIHDVASRMVIENTFESRLSKALNVLTSEIAKKLWPQKTGISDK